MADMTPMISWLSYGKDRKSQDGRWHIRHPDTCPSKRWELYDMETQMWWGDWRTCNAAKQKAEQLQRGIDHSGGDS